MRGGPNPYHYPDIAAAGDLATALRSRLAGYGTRSVSWSGAEVHAGDRFASVVMAEHERAFLVQMWMRGVQMARGETPDLDDVAGAVRLFLAGAPVRRLASAWPFTRFDGFAEAYEQSEHAAINYRWRQYLDISSTTSLSLLDLHAFLLVASGEPRLRALFPFVSHLDLGFRRSVSGSPDDALAWIRPHGDGRYLVTTDRRRLDTRVDTSPIDPEIGVALVVAVAR